MIKITRNQLKGCKNIKVLSMSSSWLLYFESPFFYNAGKYGWNYDVYIIDEYTIVRGFAVPKLGQKLSGWEKFDNTAKQIADSNKFTLKEKRKLCKDLLFQLIESQGE